MPTSGNEQTHPKLGVGSFVGMILPAHNSYFSCLGFNLDKPKNTFGIIIQIDSSKLGEKYLGHDPTIYYVYLPAANTVVSGFTFRWRALNSEETKLVETAYVMRCIAGEVGELNHTLWS